MTSSTYEIGSLVNVANRTWRGINKEGGVGRIIAINDVEKTVDVKYVLTGTEKNIDLHYVEFHKFLQDDNDKKNDDSTGRGSRRISRRVKTATEKKVDEEEKPISEKSTDKTPLRGKVKSTSEPVHPITPATSGKKVKKGKSSKSTETDLDHLIKAIKISTGPPVVTPTTKEKKKPKKRISDPKPKDSPVIVAASRNDHALKKNKKIQKKKLPVDTKELSKVINAEMVDKSPLLGSIIPEHVTKKQKTIKTKKTSNTQTIENKNNKLEVKISDIKSCPQVTHKSVNNYESKDNMSKPEQSESVTTIKNGLEVIFRDNSKKAASFVNDVVGAPLLPLVKEKSTLEETDTNNGNSLQTKTNTEISIEINNNQTGKEDKDEEDVLKISAGEERSRLFDSLLSDVMTKRMVDEISISEMLKTINGLIELPNKEFSDLELRSQLTRLEEQNRIMVTWEDGTVYQI